MSQDIDTMPAGAEMDRLVAERVMGWTWERIKVCPQRDPAIVEGWRTQPSAGNNYRTDWSPSTDIAHAWEVVERMRQRGFGTTLMTPGAFTDEGLGPMDTFSASMCTQRTRFDSWGYAEADTAPLAICRAALKVVAGPGK